MRLGLVSLALAMASCVTYSGVTQMQSGDLVITGNTSYLLFAVPWAKRCAFDGGEELKCRELTVGDASDPAIAAPRASTLPDPEESEPEPSSGVVHRSR